MAAISKNIYVDVLDGIVTKYNNMVHRTIKMKPIDVTDDSFAEHNEESNKKDPKFKMVIMQEFLSTKISLLKGMLLNSQKKFLLLIKLTIQFRGLMLLVT